MMLLQTFDYDVAKLLRSDAVVAVCRAEGDRLKRLVLLVQQARYGVVVVETADDDYLVIAIAGRRQQVKLANDIRKWSRDPGYQFVLKRSYERFFMPEPNVIAFPDGREIEILGTHTIASVFTHRVHLGRKALPAGYLQL